MRAIRNIALVAASAAIVLVAASVSAAPKQYIFTGKFSSSRGFLINIPQVGTPACGGANPLSNLVFGASSQPRT